MQVSKAHDSVSEIRARYMSIHMSTDNVVGDISTATLKFKWIIDIFNMGCKNVGSKLKSPPFTTARANKIIEWFILLFPKGRSEESKDYFSLYVWASQETTADVTLELVNSEGEIAWTRSMKQEKFSQTGKGYEKFVSRKFIFDSIGVLDDTKITISCKITLDDKKEQVEKKSIIKETDVTVHIKNCLQNSNDSIQEAINNRLKPYSKLNSD